MDKYSQSCWTCRRRRLKCDGREPACKKCATFGRQCLGYGSKPHVWAGIASRGKLKGVSSDDLLKKTHTPDDVGLHPRKFPMSSTDMLKETNYGSSERKSFRQDTHPSFTYSPWTVCLPNPSRALTDPVLQDLNTKSRSYLWYYEQRCCTETVLYEGVFGWNPFKDFISLLPHNPLILHVILAVSAFHQAKGDNVISVLSPGQGGFRPPQNASNNNSVHLHNALAFKQGAIHFLKNSLDTPNCSDEVIIATLLLIWVEILDSTPQSWKYHFDAFKELLWRRKSLDGSASQTSLQNSRLFLFFEEHYLILEVFGSTLNRTRQDLLSLVPPVELRAIMQRAETSSWLGCPAELLQILWMINSISSQLKPFSEEDVSAIFRQLHQFSPSQWADGHPQLGSFKGRYHLAVAYQGAIEIFACQVLESTPTMSRADALADDAIAHLVAIKSDDTHFKGIGWPATIAGAQTRAPTSQASVKKMLEELCRRTHAKNILYAVQTLEKIWNRTTAEFCRQPWIRDLCAAEQILLPI